jgi:hypothetical protein
MLTKQEIAGLRELLAKATEGPWDCCDGPDGYQHRLYGEHSHVVCEVTATSDAALIRAMHEALPALLDIAEAVDGLRLENERLTGLLNTPHTDDWFNGVRLEAGHQIERWGADHDVGKQPHDWFWLIGYLAGKALHAAMTGNAEKAKHHTISTGAALLNWFRAITGDSNAMRPGIEPPAVLPLAGEVAS